MFVALFEALVKCVFFISTKVSLKSCPCPFLWIQIQKAVLFVVNRDTLACQAKRAFQAAPMLRGRVALLCGGPPEPLVEPQAGTPPTAPRAEQLDGAPFMEPGPTGGSGGGGDDASPSFAPLVVVATIQALVCRHLGGGLGGQRSARAQGAEIGGEVKIDVSPAAEEKKKKKRRAPPFASLVVIDECHFAHANSYQSLAKAYPRAK